MAVTTVQEVIQRVTGVDPSRLQGMSGVVLFDLSGEGGGKVPGETVGQVEAAIAVEVAAYRIAQEALNNAYKYSKAENVRVELARDGDRLTLLIEDDGVGLAGAQTEKKDSGGHGIGNLKTRVELLNGTIAIESEPQNGVSIFVDLPI